MNWQIVITWNDGETSSPAIAASPNQAWQVADRSGTYTLERDDDAMPPPGETIVTNDVLATFLLEVTMDGQPAIAVPLASSMRVALALR